MSESNSSTQAYVFGHSVGEAQSIQQLAQILAPVTRQFLEWARLYAGMKVLEVGSGAGDVALLAADLVGPSGTVIGVDISTWKEQHWPTLKKSGDGRQEDRFR